MAAVIVVALLSPTLASAEPGFSSLQTLPNVRGTSAPDAGAGMTTRAQ